MGWDAPWHWILLAILVIALFGYKKLPEASRSLGRSLRIFKTEIKGMSEDDRQREAREVAAAPAQLPPTEPHAPTERELAPQMTPQSPQVTQQPPTTNGTGGA